MGCQDFGLHNPSKKNPSALPPGMSFLLDGGASFTGVSRGYCAYLAGVLCFFYWGGTIFAGMGLGHYLVGEGAFFFLLFLI